jgi:hypothetical protein
MLHVHSGACAMRIRYAAPPPDILHHAICALQYFLGFYLKELSIRGLKSKKPHDFGVRNMDYYYKP